MDIGCTLLEGVQQDQVNELRDGSRVRDLQQIVNSAAIHGVFGGIEIINEIGWRVVLLKVGTLNTGKDQFGRREHGSQLLPDKHGNILLLIDIRWIGNEEAGPAMQVHGQHRIFPGPFNGEIGQQYRVQRCVIE